MRKNIQKLAGLFMIAGMAAGLSGCFSSFHFDNYTFWNTPRYSYTIKPPYAGMHKNKITVVSYNIKHSAQIKEAIELFKTDERLIDADILLLQEMVPSAVEKIATELDYNYIFYPAVLHPLLHENFGNAILSKWPITFDQNIIFPPIKEKSRHRVAVAAKLRINGREILVYSLHMGVFMKPYQRSEQIQGILEAIPTDIDYCILAGDFNTIKKKDKVELVNTFTNAGFDHATANVEWTYNHWYLMNYKSAFDHIFSRGVNIIRAGKIEDNNKSSDHLPVWMEFSLTP